jgi:hypothetical protein
MVLLFVHVAHNKSNITEQLCLVAELLSEGTSMSETVLLRFLGTGLVNVGGDDSKLQKLQATTIAVSGLLKKAPSKVPSYALIAFDPNAPASDPVIIEVLASLKETWPTYVNTFASAPITVLRAIILDALVEAANEDDRVAVAVAASARNILPFMETGNESAIWVEVVNEIEASVDDRADQEWSTPSSIEIGQLPPEAVAEIKIGNSAVTVDRNALKESFRTAARANNQYPQNNPSAWANNFGDLFADALANVLDDISAKANRDRGAA